MNDLSSRADIDLLMRRFYATAMADPMIGHFFTRVVKLDLEHHLPVIGDFWENTIFATGAYRKHGRNPLQVHLALHRIEELHPEHFDRWLDLFRTTLDDSFAGPRVEFTKQRAEAIARRMLDYLSNPAG